ncbi:MAG: hypothetical protein RL757_78 [Bacteroidota bacterium]|jgi:uncharacterized OsmC-like protein
MTSIVIYEGDLRTTLTHLESQTSINTDAPKDNQGKGEAFSPTDLVATGLAACMMSIMGIYAKQHQLDIVGTKASVQKNMAAAPRRISSIDIVMEMPKHNFSEKERKALEHAAHTCPVAQSLHPDLVQNVTFIW